MLRPKKIRLILAMAIVLAGVSLIATVILKVEQRKSPAEKLDPLPHNVEMALQKVHYSEVKDGVKKWDLFADQAFFDAQKESFHLKGVRLILVAEKRIGDITLTAGEADYYSKEKNVELSGNVVAKSDTGMRFSSDSAKFVGASALISTDDPVRFIDGRIEVSGIGMELKTTTRDLKIKKDVTADTMGGHRK